MPKLKRVAIREWDDWMVLYLDGKAVQANHRLHPEEILEAIGIEADYKYYDHEDIVSKRSKWEEVPDDLSILNQWEREEDWREPIL